MCPFVFAISQPTPKLIEQTLRLAAVDRNSTKIAFKNVTACSLSISETAQADVKLKSYEF